MIQRIEKWDILKFGLIFLVVLGHVADYYTEGSGSMRSLFLLIYSFHMPLFIFVSGLFCKNTVDQLKKDRVVGFLLIYLFSRLLMGVYNAIYIGEFDFDFFTTGGFSWYMLAMVWFIIITHYIKNIKPQYVLAISIIVAMLAGYDGRVGDKFAISRTIVFFPFFYLGYIIDSDKLQKITDKKWIKLVSLVGLVVFAAAIFLLGDKIYSLRPLFTGRNSYSYLDEKEIIGGLIRLGCYVVSLVVGFAVIAITPNRLPFKFVSTFGARTLSVYVYHSFVIYLLFNHLYFKEFFEAFIPTGSQLLAIPLSVAITLVLSLKPFSNSVNAIINLPKKMLK